VLLGVFRQTQLRSLGSDLLLSFVAFRCWYVAIIA